jgi:hypothetical protein
MGQTNEDLEVMFFGTIYDLMKARYLVLSWTYFETYQNS